MNERIDANISDNSSVPLPMEDNDIVQEICSFSKTNVNEIEVVENAEDIDGAPAPLPDCFIKENENKEAPLPPNVSALKKVLDESREKLSEMQKKLVEELHKDDAKILKVDDDKNNSASVYLQFDEKKYGDNAKIKNAIRKAIEYAKNNNQNFEINQKYLPYIKSIFVDRKSVKKYSQGGGDDEVLLNGGFDDRELTSLKFYQKHNKHPGESKYNMIMVAEYKFSEKTAEDEISEKTEYCIIDMDNNLMISNDTLKLYSHCMDDFENHGLDDKDNKVYETGWRWHAFRINNRLRNNGFTDAKKFIITNGSKLYGIKTLQGLSQEKLDKEFLCEREGENEVQDWKYLTWVEVLSGKISKIIDSINGATTIQQLYETFLQGIQKDLLKVNYKNTKDYDNNFLYLNGGDIVGYFCKDSKVNKTINKSDFLKKNTSTSDFKQKILDEIFKNNTGSMDKIDFVKAFLEKATQHIVDAISDKMEKLPKKTTTEVDNKNEDLDTQLGSGTELRQFPVTSESETPTCKCGCNTETCLSLFDYVKSLFTSNKSNNR